MLIINPVSYTHLLRFGIHAGGFPRVQSGYAGPGGIAGVYEEGKRDLRGNGGESGVAVSYTHLDPEIHGDFRVSAPLHLLYERAVPVCAAGDSGQQGADDDSVPVQ